jgi:hypothetical protein
MALREEGTEAETGLSKITGVLVSPSEISYSVRAHICCDGFGDHLLSRELRAQNKSRLGQSTAFEQRTEQTVCSLKAVGEKWPGRERTYLENPKVSYASRP